MPFTIMLYKMLKQIKFWRSILCMLRRFILDKKRLYGWLCNGFFFGTAGKTRNDERRYTYQDQHKHKNDNAEVGTAFHHAVNLIYYFFKHDEPVVDIIAERRREEQRRYYGSKLPARLYNAHGARERPEKQH